MIAKIRNPEVRLLCIKASQDESALEFDLSDEIYGFLAQQCCEKFFKALISSRGVQYERVHSLRRLIDRLFELGEKLPDTPTDLIFLDPFAVRFRYDIGGISGVDRIAIRESVTILRHHILVRILELEEELLP